MELFVKRTDLTAEFNTQISHPAFFKPFCKTLVISKSLFFNSRWLCLNSRCFNAPITKGTDKDLANI